MSERVNDLLNEVGHEVAALEAGINAANARAQKAESALVEQRHADDRFVLVKLDGSVEETAPIRVLNQQYPANRFDRQVLAPGRFYRVDRERGEFSQFSGPEAHRQTFLYLGTVGRKHVYGEVA